MPSQKRRLKNRKLNNLHNETTAELNELNELHELNELNEFKHDVCNPYLRAWFEEKSGMLSKKHFN